MAPLAPVALDQEVRRHVLVTSDKLGARNGVPQCSSAALSATFQHLVAPFHCWYGAQGGAPTTSTVWVASIPFVCTLRRLTPSTEKVVVHMTLYAACARCIATMSLSSLRALALSRTVLV